MYLQSPSLCHVENRSSKTSTTLWRARSWMAQEGVSSCCVHNISQLGSAHFPRKWCLIACRVFILQVYVYLRCSGHRENCHGARGDQVSAACSRAGGDPAVSLHRDQRNEDDRPAPGLCPDSSGVYYCCISTFSFLPSLILILFAVLCVIEINRSESNTGSCCCLAGETLQYTSTEEGNHSAAGGRGENPNLLQGICWAALIRLFNKFLSSILDYMNVFFTLVNNLSIVLNLNIFSTGLLCGILTNIL